ncbi:MAG: 23S rRNA (adenine(2503)-C(2))-methyltransferase RlmN, partial [Niameybacter sp.]
MNDIISVNLTELEALMQELKQGKFRAKQLFDWLHNKMVWNYDEMSNLPSGLRDILKEKYPLTSIKTLEKYE